MPNETVNTTNKLIKPEDISESDNDVIRQLSENLQDVTTEDINAMCDEMDEAKKRREEEKKKWEIPQELSDYRKKWKEKDVRIWSETKEKIIKASENIPVKIETDSDGSRLIELKIWWKKWKILDPKLKRHSDEAYFDSYWYVRAQDEEVKMWWMMWDDVEKWENQKLKEYVQQKQQEWLDISSENEIKKLFEGLGKEIDSDDLSDEIAMFMYLTGMNWLYRLSMIDLSVIDSNSRYILQCYDTDRRILIGNDSYFASLCMIACE